jgi:negative regulator of sigma E activity
MVAMTAAPAAAIDTLEDYLAEAEASEYAGRRIVMTTWNGDAEVGIYDVTHAGDVTVIGDGHTSVSSGKVAVEDGGVTVLDWSRSGLADRYTVIEVGAVERIGRDARAIEVYEGTFLRAAVTFDEATGAPLATQMYDADGDLFRYSAMLDFDDRPNVIYRDITATGLEYDVMVPVADPLLPAELSGYQRTDAYRSADNWMHTFYSDGLFSFSVFEAGRAVTLSEFAAAGTFESGNRSYSLLVRPTDVWVSWRTGGTTMVLVGDLPPDHLDDVLSDLPAPDKPGFLKRLWRGLFG